MTEDAAVAVAVHRDRVRSWLEDHREELRAMVAAAPDELTGDAEVVRSLAAAGLSRQGWPVSVGGVGGGVLHRAVLYDELTRASLGVPHWYLSLEVCAPAMIAFAPHLEDAVRRGIEGTDLWCQGFSEPAAGSDLPALRTRAVRDGALWRLHGEKIWVSMGHVATHCLLLARTGEQGARTRGLTMFFVPLAEVAEQQVIPGLSGRDELGQIVFDGGAVGDDAVVGEVGAGWDVVVYLLQWERGLYAWQRYCWLVQQFEAFCVGDPSAAAEHLAPLGEVSACLIALRNRCLGNLALLHAGQFIGPEASIEKVLLAKAETTLFDVVREARRLGVMDREDRQAAMQTADYFYSRMASVYGGSEEIQLDTIGERLLGLPRDPAKATTSAGRA